MSPGTARVCVTNAKGGTGKTTVAINVAGALNERGRDVLFVDLDPQGNATEGLGLTAEYDRDPPSLFDVLTDHDQRLAVNDVIVEHDEMDVLPSNVDLLQVEHELVIAELIERMTANPQVSASPDVLTPLSINVTPETVGDDPAIAQLNHALDAVTHDYEYVVIDSPPFYGKLTDAAIYAAPSLVVPALTEVTSQRAIELLFAQCSARSRETGVDVTECCVVANRVEATAEDAMMLEWFDRVFPDVPIHEVRKRVALQRAFSNGHSVFQGDDDLDMAAVFRAIAADLDAHFMPEEVPA